MKEESKENVLTEWLREAISYNFCNKLSQTKWLKATETYFLTVLDGRHPKSVLLGRDQSVSRTMLPFEALGESLFLAFPASSN